MPERQEESILVYIFELLLHAPIWVGPILATLSFVLFRFVFPALIPPKQAGVDPEVLFRPLFFTLAWIFPSVILMMWGMAEFWKLIKRLGKKYRQ